MRKGNLLLVLHAHLPYVHHPEYERFLEERWLFEAITDSYIPLIKFFDRLLADGLRFKVTLSLSPTLCAMLEDPQLRRRYERHLELSLKLAQAEVKRTEHWADVNRLARMYQTLFEEAHTVFVERCRTRLLPVFDEYDQEGVVELITCAATHGFLPSFASEPSTVRTQIFVAVSEFERLFGRKPKGMWLPECGFYPGLDEVLAQAGIRYTFVDAHGLEYATPRPLFGVHAPVYCPSGVAVFARNPATSKLVWSSRVGYPADPGYREYYRDIGFELDAEYLAPFQYASGVRSNTGIKYHRITGPGPDKHLYDPDQGREIARRHARDFVDRCRAQASRAAEQMPYPAVIVSPYDAELFGHWWFEGPQWIHFVLRELAAEEEDLALCTPGEYLSSHPVQQQARPAPSTWGRDGFNEYWINPKTEWLYRPLHEASLRLRAVLRAVEAAGGPTPEQKRALKQAGRELLLSQSSDWPFAISGRTTEEYAARRFIDHLNRFHDIVEGLELGAIDGERLGALEAMDAVFPTIDYRLFGAP